MNDLVGWLRYEAHDCAEMEGMKLYCERINEAADCIEQLQDAFRHTHNAVGMDSDKCADCGLNLRNSVHK